MLGAGALGRPRGMVWGGRREEGSGWGTHVYLWLIHVNVWKKPPQYCKVISLQLNALRFKKSVFMAPTPNLIILGSNSLKNFLFILIGG